MAYIQEAQLKQKIAEALGKEKYLSELRKHSSEAMAKVAQLMAQQLGKNDLAAWALDLKQPNHFWKHVLTTKIVEETKNTLEVKVTGCLWAKTFKESFRFK